MYSRLHSRRPRPPSGFSLIEFMIAITVSLLILAAMSSTFVANSRARTELERANQQIENGRYAMQVLSDDLQLAGYLSHFQLSTAVDSPVIVVPGTVFRAGKPDPCTNVVANLTDALALHLQGYDNAPDTDNDGDADHGFGCLPANDVRPRTDILVVRHAKICTLGTPDCGAANGIVAGAPYFQASLCDSSNELRSLTANEINKYRLDTTIANLDRTQRDCTTAAVMRQYLVHIYFVANNDQPGDGIPTLKRAELGAGAAFTTASIANGIENLQLEYGLDTDNNSQPDVYTASPDIFNRALPAAPFADCITNVAPGCIQNWRDVMAVSVNLLARNTFTTREYTDCKTYALGLQANGTAYTVGANPANPAVASPVCAFPVGAPTPTVVLSGDGLKYKRHAYSSTVRLINPAGRR